MGSTIWHTTMSLDGVHRQTERFELGTSSDSCPRLHSDAPALLGGKARRADLLATCEGAATIGLELADAAVQFDVVLIALGGGALASGVGHVMRELCPGTQVVAIQPVGAPAMALSWRKRAVVTTDTIDTIADGVAGRYPIPEVLEDLLEIVDDVVLVDDDSIKGGMRQLFDLGGLVVEPSAALGVAAIVEHSERFLGLTVATIVCGSNISRDDFRRWALDSARRQTKTTES